MPPAPCPREVGAPGALRFFPHTADTVSKGRNVSCIPGASGVLPAACPRRSPAVQCRGVPCTRALAGR